MTLGDQIKRLRTARGWTREELAGRIGVTGAYLSMLESGKRANPTRDVVRKLAEALGVPVAELEGEPDPYASPMPPVPTWRAAGVREDQIARAAAVWADMTRDQRRDVAAHLEMSARSLATVDALIEQVQVRLDTLQAQIDEGDGAPPAGHAIRPEDALDIEADDQATRHGHMLFAPR